MLRPGRVAATLALGHKHSCALLIGGGVVCWGRNYHGQLGLGSNADVGTSAWQLGSNLLLVELGDGQWTAEFRLNTGFDRLMTSRGVSFEWVPRVWHSQSPVSICTGVLLFKSRSLAAVCSLARAALRC